MTCLRAFHATLAAICFVAALVTVLIAHDGIESRFSPTKRLVAVAVLLIAIGIVLLGI